MAQVPAPLHQIHRPASLDLDDGAAPLQQAEVQSRSGASPQGNQAETPVSSGSKHVVIAIAYTLAHRPRAAAHFQVPCKLHPAIFRRALAPATMLCSSHWPRLSPERVSCAELVRPGPISNLVQASIFLHPRHVVSMPSDVRCRRSSAFQLRPGISCTASSSALWAPCEACVPFGTLLDVFVSRASGRSAGDRCGDTLVPKGAKRANVVCGSVWVRMARVW